MNLLKAVYLIKLKILSIKKMLKKILKMVLYMKVKPIQMELEKVKVL